jgi:hypothetical protein
LAGPEIFDGRLHCPHFIYFRGGTKLSDEQILAHFELSSYFRAKSYSEFATYAVIANSGDWTVLADDWLYTLWHQPSKRTAIETLAEERDLFAWSVGDCDRSFDFYLYRCGQLVRKHVVESPRFTDQIVTADFGERLPSETELLASNLDISIKLDLLTRSLGIDTAVSQDSLRVYWKPRKPPFLG